MSRLMSVSSMLWPSLYNHLIAKACSNSEYSYCYPRVELVWIKFICSDCNDHVVRPRVR